MNDVPTAHSFVSDLVLSHSPSMSPFHRVTLFPSKRQCLSILWLHSKQSWNLYPPRAIEAISLISGGKNQEVRLSNPPPSVVKAQGDTVFGGRRRSILLNWGNGWGPSFGTGRSGEASSSKLHHPDPHHLLPHFCFRRTFLGENTTELRFLQNIFF